MDNLQRVKESCKTAIVAKKNYSFDTQASLINMLSVLNKLLNLKLKRTAKMNDSAEQLESQSSRLATMKLTIKESMKASILLFSLSEQRRYVKTVSSIQTLQKMLQA